MDSMLAGSLRSRGFTVLRSLKGTSTCSIFCVTPENDTSQEEYVAKVVSLTGLDAQGRAGAQQEVSLLKGLAKHPNLIAYRESFLEDTGGAGAGILFIVMSLAEDGDLRRVVTESTAVQRAIPEHVVLSWTRQTLTGLSHLHSQGVVHRDLKSSNIFLCDRRRRIRIGDFGISRVLESTAFASSCVGTPAYMSPELMRNERYDYHVDMWALGCIVFELVTLKLPFTANSLLDLVYQVVETEPDWSRWAGFSEELHYVAMRLLQKDVSMRPTAFSILEESLFAEGGVGSFDPSEEIWAVVAPHTADQDRSPDKRALTTLSTSAGQLTTADTGNAINMGSNSASTWEHSREDFQMMMSTFQETCGPQLRAELRAAANSAGSGGSTGGSTVSRLLHEGLGISQQVQPVPETVV
jgi:NIMA (never in mitosis gene a)-related kinase